MSTWIHHYNNRSNVSINTSRTCKNRFFTSVRITVSRNEQKRRISIYTCTLGICTLTSHVCDSTLGICIRTFHVCVITLGICTRTFHVCVITLGICTRTFRICVITLGICTRTYHVCTLGFIEIVVWII